MARPAPAATRAALIVSFLTAHPSRGFTITELVKQLRMNIASAHATLAVLGDAGFVTRDPVHRTYVLGPALAATGFASLQQHPAIGFAIDQAELLAEELDAEVCVSALAGRDVILLARRGPEPLGTALGYPGDRTPLLAPVGAVFMAWTDDGAAVTQWLERASLSPPLMDFYRRVLVDIRERGFSVPMPAIAAPTVVEAVARLREEPNDEAERHYAEAFRDVEELLLLPGELDPLQEVRFKTVASPIFDPIGRVLLSISVTAGEEAVPVVRVLELGHRVSQSASIATRRARGRVPTKAEIEQAVDLSTEVETK
jgi:DNA-binding IclR family transcriptional regulator